MHHAFMISKRNLITITSNDFPPLPATSFSVSRLSPAPSHLWSMRCRGVGGVPPILDSRPIGESIQYTHTHVHTYTRDKRSAITLRQAALLWTPFKANSFFARSDFFFTQTSAPTYATSGSRHASAPTAIKVWPLLRCVPVCLKLFPSHQ